MEEKCPATSHASFQPLNIKTQSVLLLLHPTRPPQQMLSPPTAQQHQNLHCPPPTRDIIIHNECRIKWRSTKMLLIITTGVYILMTFNQKQNTTSTLPSVSQSVYVHASHALKSRSAPHATHPAFTGPPLHLQG
jgi:hypothetical protein